MLIAGLQVPVIPLVEVVGRAGIDAPEQYGPTVAKVGNVGEVIVIVNVVVVAHNPVVGVKVYVVVTVLLIAGLHVPVIPFVEVVGSAGIDAPEQNEPTGLNVGVTFGLIVIVNVTGKAHTPVFGVNV